ncbi:hypothetical protein PPUJ20028_10040 [Pseudomonas putida]|uniref:Metallo-beta-lactamase domain-containing protein n=1 Tax=Pseudomonas putida TaxID=303 RepID=A0AA37VVG4_PSEPU|nr:hypothetical protein [Pseudomonas putida]GLO12423.1 hypothetical protein PPUJ20028_10040 [Pseudomonas putida]GLO35195.1 hypothetical protein PPUN14671_20280 [Pseudomonas putida]HDS0966312.1 hypothetical protein [Pseudomonas putida]HDS0992600.1 hypothetical protein [Pseudomonas putida]
MSYQRLYFLDVGQGMSTFFEEYDASGTIVANALFDLGSNKNKVRAGKPARAFLAKQILANTGGVTGSGYLNAVFLSHKDSDHINMILELLEELPYMEIGKVFYSGSYNWYMDGGINVLTELGKRTTSSDKDVMGFPIAYTGLKGPTQADWTPLWGTTHAVAYVIAVNTVSSGSSTSIGSYTPNGDVANSTSLGIYLQVFNVGAVIFGDATYTTFEFVNNLFHTFTFKLDCTFALQAPHHGSRKTTFGLKVSTDPITLPQAQVVNTFAYLMGAATVVVSADTLHKHPSLQTIDAFVTYADNTNSWWYDPLIPPYHYTTTYFDAAYSLTLPTPYGISTYQTRQNFYTTLYHSLYGTPWNFSFAPLATATPLTGVPSEGMNWFYQVDSKSTRSPDTITMTGVPSGRLPETAVELERLFVDARASRTAGRQAENSTALMPRPPTTNRARPPATEQRQLRQLKSRR